MPGSKDFNPTATVTAEPTHVSLEGMHSTVEVPHHDAGFWPKWRGFIGPAVFVCVGSLGPGHWGTDFAAGAQYKNGRLWGVAGSRPIGSFMQGGAPPLG